MKKINKGFTLIELLVVISIIGLLSSVVLASLNSARGKGRDAQRVSTLQEIQKAVELYALNNNGTYPRTTGVNSSDSGRSNSCATYTTNSCGAGNGDAGGTTGSCSQPLGNWSGTLSTLITNNLLSSVSNDPINKGYATANSLCYTYTTYPNSTWTMASPGSHWHTMTCDGEPIGQYEYALLFSTESATFNLPKFGISANKKYNGFSNGGQDANTVWSTYKYCILGPKRG